MNEDFVSFSIAKKLKEKGYTLDTAHHYDDNGGIVVSLVEFDERCVYPCPEIHQVLKWLREEKKIYVYPNYLPSSDKWICLIYDINEPRMYSVIDCIGFTESELLGIQYVIDNLI